MMRLRLLGLEFPVSGGQIQPPTDHRVEMVPAYSGGTITDNKLSFQALLVIRGVYSLYFNVSNVTLRHEDGELQVPEDGLVKCLFFRLWRDPLRAPLGGPALVVELGPIRLAKTGQMDDWAIYVKNGELKVRISGAIPVIQPDEGVPLIVGSGNFAEDTSGIHLNLGEGIVTVPSGWLSCDCFASAKMKSQTGEIMDVRAFRRTLAAQDLMLVLNSRTDQLDVIMQPVETDQPLVLHAEYEDDGAILGGLGVKKYHLKLRFSPGEDRKAKLSGIWLEPTIVEGTVELICYGLADASNQAERWKVQEPISLVIRLMEGETMPGCLLIAAENGLKRPTHRSSEAIGNMHGGVPKIEWLGLSSGYLVCDRAEPGPASEQLPIDDALFFKYTVPWLELNTPTLTHPKAGDSYRPNNVLGTSSLWEFSNASAGTPILPNLVLDKAGELAVAFRKDLDKKIHELGHKLQSARHASNMTEQPVDHAPPLQIQRLFQYSQSPPFFRVQSVSESAIRLNKYSVIREFGPIQVMMPIDPELPIDYVVIPKNDPNFKFQGDFSFALDPEVGSLKLGGQPDGINNILGIVKLGISKTLADVLGAIKQSKLSEGIDPNVLDNPGWVGLVMFGVALDFSNFPILTRLVDNLSMQYVSLSPSASDQAFSVSGRVKWKNQNTDTDDYDRDKEVRFQVKKVDLAWIDRRLRQFHVESSLTFAGAFGLLIPDGKDLPEISIIGSYSDLNGKSAFRFLGQSSDPIPLLPRIEDPSQWFGPIEQISIERAEITESGGDVAIQLDGTVKLHSVPLPNFENAVQAVPDQHANFRGLGINIPHLDGHNPNIARWLSLNYPSLKFDAKLPQFKFFGIEALDLKVRSIGLDWEGKFPWTSLVPIGGKLDDKMEKAFLMDVRLNLMKLPELFAKSLQGLAFDLSMGFGLGSNTHDPYFDEKRFNVGITAVGFEKLHLDLMRFLEIEADELELGVIDFGGADQVPILKLVRAKVSILGHLIIPDLTAMFFATKGGKTGFLAYIKPEPPVSFSFVDVKWVLIGQNVALPTELAKGILSIAPDPDHDGISKSIGESVKGKELYIGTDGLHAEWLFAAGLSIASESFSGKFLFHDGRQYGMSLQGTMLKEWFGYDLAISVLYVKGSRPAEDRLFLSFTVPKVAIGTFNFMGGVIDLGVVMNGGFLIDVGFPHLLPSGSGGRDWNRALGAIVTPFQGSGGLYLRKEIASIENGAVVSLMGGYALQAGLGASFGGGVFTAWVTAGLYVITEGHFAFKRENLDTLTGLRLVGAVGILVQGAAALDWWIISVRVDVRAEAEARLILAWGIDPIDPPEHIPEDPNPVSVNLEFVLIASASARACIGSGPFKLCKGISVTVPMHFNQPLKIGRS